MKRLCMKLDDFTNLLEVDTHSHINTTTVWKHPSYLISWLGKRRKPKAAQCTYMTSLTRFRYVKCISMFQPCSCLRGSGLHEFKAFHMCTSCSTRTPVQNFSLYQIVKNKFPCCTCRNLTLNLQITSFFFNWAMLFCWKSMSKFSNMYVN